MNHKIYKKVVLIILDGFGISPANRGNPISLVERPNLDKMVASYPALSLQAAGPLVGLPWGEMGNSEVGHLNIGAGRIVAQDLPRINNAIQSGGFFKNPAFLEAINHAKKNNSCLHLMGLVSPGGVHSSDEHLYALLGLCEQQGLDRVFIHMFTDGRDTEEKVALDTLRKLEMKIQQTKVGAVAGITGRFYAMDRGGHWEQTMQTYNALVFGQGQSYSSSEDCIKQNYGRQIFDEMIQPSVIVDQFGQPLAKIQDNDAIIFLNFRSDRAIQLTQAFVLPQAVPENIRPQPPQNLCFVTMAEYLQDLPVIVAFPRMDLKNNLSEELSKQHLSQFHIAESEKYAHVTSFFNCGRSEKLPGEEWEIVKSPQDNARNYSDNPQMSAKALTDILEEKITKSEVNFFVANYANADMVGHTGDLQAAQKAVSCLDEVLGRIMQATLLADAALIITADHGNVEQMINPKTGGIDKDHSTNPVPCLLIMNELKFKRPLDKNFLSLSALVPEGMISDIAPTILDLFGLPRPPEMTGVNLLRETE